MNDDLLQRLLAVMEETVKDCRYVLDQHKLSSIKSLRAELADAIAAGARLVAPEKTPEPVVHWWPGSALDPVACGTRGCVLRWTDNTERITCPACLAVMHTPTLARCEVMTMEAFR
jgi:hypothetical protein